MAGPAAEALRDEPLLSPEVESRKLRELREKENALQNEEQTLKSKQFAGVDIAALNDELADLSARYSDLANQRQIPTASDECP